MYDNIIAEYNVYNRRVFGISDRGYLDGAEPLRSHEYARRAAVRRTAQAPLYRPRAHQQPPHHVPGRTHHVSICLPKPVKKTGINTDSILEKHKSFQGLK
jgi:hypothetical protein